MDDELNYAEMLEIPVETVTVRRKERKKKEKEPDLRERLVEEVNEKLESEDPSYAESTPIARDVPYEGRKKKMERRVIVGEFVAVCALCAAIFLTNIFLPNSAINTFVRGLFGAGETAQTDMRTYSEFTLSPVVNDTVNAELAVSETGVLSFTSQCSVYSPCAGKLASLNGNAETGYTVEVKHSEHFSTIISGLDHVYAAAGDEIKSNIPLGYTDGNGEVRVMFYEDGTLLNCLTVNDNTLAWS